MGKYKIPYANLAAQHSPIKTELLDAIGEVLDEGNFILGAQVEEFERQFSALCGTQYAIGVANGTDALMMALKVLDIKHGDEVITVPNSFVASTSCIRLVGATPVFVDVCANQNIDVTQIAAAITSHTRAILPVHLTGRPADMNPILALAKDHQLFVIEDAAQAVGAEYWERRVGSFGDIGCFSLHPLKTLNACGDAGIITTNNPVLAEKLRLLRNLGLRSRDDCVIWSGNSRLDTLQAAILLVKLRYFKDWTDRRRQIAARYRAALQGIPNLYLPQDAAHEKAVYHTFVIQCDQRDALKTYLAEHGIGTNIHYPLPIHLSNAGRELGYSAGRFPVTEVQAKRILSLPIFQELTDLQIDEVTTTIRRFYT